MHGELEQRAERPDRREPTDPRRHDEDSPQEQVRRGPDYDGRRHFTPRTGLAFGQRYVSWAEPETEADETKNAATAPKASASASALSSLIRRHQDGVAKSVSPQAGPAPAPQPAAAPSPDVDPAAPRLAETRTAAGPTKVDLSYLSRADDQRPASPKSPADVAAPSPPAPRKRKILRKKVTLRLEIDHFQRIDAIADRGGKFRQSVLAAAVAAYLNKAD